MGTQGQMLPAGELPLHWGTPTSPGGPACHPLSHNLGLQGGLNPIAAPQNQLKTQGWVRSCLHPWPPAQPLLGGHLGLELAGGSGRGGPSQEPLVLEGAQLTAGRVFFFSLALC